MPEAPERPSVLLVDDEVLVQDLVQEALEEAGYEVIAASTGAEALTELQRERHFVGLVTDINLGVPPMGWDVASRARGVNPMIAVVYMTGDSAHDWSARGVPLSTVVSKPFAVSQVVVALATQLNTADGAA